MRLYHLVAACIFALPANAAVYQFSATDLSNGRIDQVNSINPGGASGYETFDGPEGYGTYSWGHQQLWVSFAVDSFEVMSNEVHTFDIDLPGVFSVSGARPFGLPPTDKPDWGNIALQFHTSNLNSARVKGSGRFNFGSTTTMNAVPLNGTNCCNNFLVSSDILPTSETRFDNVSASVVFAETKRYIGGNVVEEVDRFTVDRIGFLLTATGGISYTSPDFNFEYAPLPADYYYRFSPPFVSVPLPTPGPMLAISLIGFGFAARVRAA